MKSLPIENAIESPASQMRGFFAFEVTNKLPGYTRVTEKEVMRF
jgi:hypothetical protein